MLDLQSLVIGGADHAGILAQPLAGQRRDRGINDKEGEDRDGGREGRDKKQRRDEEHGDDAGDQHLHQRLDKVEDQDFDLVGRGDQRARVALDVKGVGLAKDPPLRIERELMPDAIDKALGKPGELEADEARDHRKAGEQQSGCGNAGSGPRISSSHRPAPASHGEGTAPAAATGPSETG